MTRSGPVVDWLLDSDPSIRWQVMRDLLDAPGVGVARRSGPRSRREGWGARLLVLEDEDGQWAGGAFAPRDFDAQRVAGGRPAVDGHDVRAVAAPRVRPRSGFGPGPARRRADRRQLALGA